MDNDEACFMHPTPGVVHKFPKAVGVFLSFFPSFFIESVSCDLQDLPTVVYVIQCYNNRKEPYAQKVPRFLFAKRRGQPREIWSLASTIDGSALPQDYVEELLCGTRSNW